MKQCISKKFRFVLAVAFGAAALLPMDVFMTNAWAGRGGGKGGGGDSVINLCVDFGAISGNGMQNAPLTSEYCHTSSNVILAQINGKGQFTFSSQDELVFIDIPGSQTGGSSAPETAPPAGLYTVGPLISYGDGTGVVDLTALTVGAPAKDVRLEISFDVPVEPGGEETRSWTVVFHDMSDAKLPCSGGSRAKVSRQSEIAWTIETSSSQYACLYEKVPTGKANKTEPQFRGMIHFPVRIGLLAQ